MGLNGNYRWASGAFSQDSLTTYKYHTQYAVWVDANKHGRIAARFHGRSFGPSVDLFAVLNSDLIAFADDSHNSINVAVDSTGFLHVAGNMHSGTLRYMKSVYAENMDHWTSPVMVNSAEETTVTYPMFVKCNDGTLLFFYREGTSSSGDWFCNKYDTTTKTWSRVGKIWGGVADGFTAYPHHIAVDRVSGRIHTMWTWRDTADASSNENICYAYSDDKGTTWKKTDGTSYVLPITKATSEVVVAATGNLMNNGGLEVDSSGRPHSAWLIGGQIHHVWYNGVGWINQQVTAWDGSPLVTRPAVACFNDGRVWLVFNTNYQGRTGIRYFNVTGSEPTEHVLYEGDFLSWEASIDTQALYQRNELHMLVAPMRADGALPGDLLTNQTAIVLEV